MHRLATGGDNRTKLPSSYGSNVDVLRLVEGAANTSAVILQEMTVPHHLELARSDAAGASLGPIGQQKVNCDFLSRMTTPVVIGEKLPSPQQNRPA